MSEIKAYPVETSKSGQHLNLRAGRPLNFTIAAIVEYIEQVLSSSTDRRVTKKDMKTACVGGKAISQNRFSPGVAHVSICM